MNEAGGKLRINPTVVAQAMPDGAVLIDSATGECFELNRIGARVWERLSRGEDLARITDSLAAEFALERAVISSDVTRLFEDLTRHGIVVAPTK
jgi:coenzyme PQQ synthesis protein D (PqqD)